jgi:sporulation protein YlmC with PRC-barrel domain
MARHASIGTIIAAAALISYPVLAQTTATPGTPAGPGTTSRTTTATTTTAPADTGVSTRFFTADHQVRASKVVGASVYNDQNQTIGSIDDVLMSDSTHKVNTAVISVGGFLGMGSKLVSVPFDQLKVNNDRIVMPGATKTSLQSMPGYRYTNA